MARRSGGVTAAAPGPLSGWTVVVTRARPQASSLAARVRDLGARVVEVPVIEIGEPADRGAALRAAAARLVGGAYDWVACTSQNAVGRLVDALDDRPVPAATRWAAVGQATAGAIARAGHEVDLVAPEGTAASLAGVFPPGPSDPGWRGPHVLFPRAARVDGDLAERLRAAGYLVDDVVAYQTVRSRPDRRVLERARTADAVAFTSSSTIAGLIEAAGRDAVPPVVVTIGPQTSAAARRAGLDVAAEAGRHDLDGLVGALVAARTAFRPGAGGGGGQGPGPA